MDAMITVDAMTTVNAKGKGQIAKGQKGYIQIIQMHHPSNPDNQSLSCSPITNPTMSTSKRELIKGPLRPPRPNPLSLSSSEPPASKDDIQIRKKGNEVKGRVHFQSILILILILILHDSHRILVLSCAATIP